MKKTPAIVKKELQLTIALVIAATILSHISLPFFDHANFHIDFFIALFASVVILERHNLSLLKIFLLGIGADIILGAQLGAFALIFLLMFAVHYFFTQLLIFKTSAQKLILMAGIIFLGIIIEFILNADASIPLLVAPLIINFFFTAIAAGGFYLIMNFRKN